MAQRYSPVEACRTCDATPEELASFERRGILVPLRPFWPPWRRDAYYTPDQLRVLRWLLTCARDDGSRNN